MLLNLLVRYLDNNRISGDLCQTLASFSLLRLQSLSLSSNSFDSDSCFLTSNNNNANSLLFPFLRQIDISHNPRLNFTANRASFAAMAPALQQIDLSSTSIVLSPSAAEERVDSSAGLLVDANSTLTCQNQWRLSGAGGGVQALSSPMFATYLGCFCTNASNVWSGREKQCVPCPANAACSVSTSVGAAVPTGESPPRPPRHVFLYLSCALM